MPKYLIRGGRSPLETVPVEKYVTSDLWGFNVGNYIYLDAVIRTLTYNKKVQFDCSGYQFNYSTKELDRINEEYDGFIIPLADAFRPNFVDEMRQLTAFINQLKIPCYIIGVGCAAGSEKRLLEKNFGFEKEAIAFIKAVLNRSACVGLRGHFTGEFLKYLGFREDKDFRVIGCPSFYMYGHHLRIRDTIINSDSKVGFNGTTSIKEKTLEKMNLYAAQFSDITFVSQNHNEFRTYYLGLDYIKDKTLESLYPCNICHPLYANDQVRFFYNTNDWIDFYRGVDFTFGTRFHGNVASILAGTPTIMFLHDIRMKELAEFHQLTAVDEDQLEQFKDIWEIIDSVDFHQPEKIAKKNFENYIDFLHCNGLQTIYDKNMNRTDAPLDRLIQKAQITPEPTSFVSCSNKEQLQRLQTSYENLLKDKARLRETIKKLRSKNNTLKTKVKKLQNKT